MDVVSQFLMLFTGLILGFIPAGQTLSYVAPARPHIERPKQVTILFGGDMMFDRAIRVTSEKKGGDFIFSCLDPILREPDLVVANLEGPITSKDSKSIGTMPPDLDNFTFTFPTSTAPLLAKHRISLLNLGNNHILNFGWKGLASTTEALRGAGVDYFGDPLDQRVAEKEINGIRFAFINYNEFAPPPSSASTTIEQIIQARSFGQLPIVFTHWGEEYLPATELEISLAHRFVDVGAEIVIGTHPHVVQEHVLYVSSTTPALGEKHIYYSLGNLIFDQYWNESVRRGLMLRVEFDKDGVHAIKEIPVELLRDRRTCPIEA